MTARITLEELRAKGACVAAVVRFFELFGDYVEPTEELRLEYLFDFNWANGASKLLSPASYRVFINETSHAWSKYMREGLTAREQENPQARHDLLDVQSRVFLRLWQEENSACRSQD